MAEQGPHITNHEIIVHARLQADHRRKTNGPLVPEENIETTVRDYINETADRKKLPIHEARIEAKRNITYSANLFNYWFSEPIEEWDKCIAGEQQLVTKPNR